MPYSSSNNIPLGEMLTSARLKHGFSRAEVARATGINEGSIARYERAGVEAGGQYPPSTKLAQLCVHLSINPALAIYACLGVDDPRSQDALFQQLEEPKSHRLLAALHNLGLLSQENRTLRYALGVLAQPIPQSTGARERYEFVQKRVQNMLFVGLDSIEDLREYERTQFTDFEAFDLETRQQVDDFSWLPKADGSDRDDPSRPVSQTSEAVGSAHDQPPEEGLTDE